MLLARALQASGDGLSGAGRWRKGGACVLLTPVTVPHSPQNRRITPIPAALRAEGRLKAQEPPFPVEDGLPVSEGLGEPTGHGNRRARRRASPATGGHGARTQHPGTPPGGARAPT